MTNKEIRERLNDHFDHVTLNKGVWTVRVSFFFTHGRTVNDVLSRIEAAMPSPITVVDKGEVWKRFRGGASVAQQSHWFVKFTVS